MFAHRVTAAVVVLLLASLASAQTGPQLLTVFPPGGKAGESVEITCTGIGFDGDEKLLFQSNRFKAERLGGTNPDPKAPKGTAATSVKFKVNVPNDLPGIVDVRVVSKSGLSNPRTFVVGDLLEANEVEPNNDVAQAQKIALDSTVNGVISAPTDVDYVTFKAKAGQNVVVYCLTSSIDSRLSADLMVIGPDGKPLVENRGYRGGDAVLDFKAPTDGDYLVRVSQFAYTTGGNDHFYRLTVTSGGWVDAVFPPVLQKADSRVTVYGRNLPLSGESGKPAASVTGSDGRTPQAFTTLATASSHLFAGGVLDPLDYPIPPASGSLDGAEFRVQAPDKTRALNPSFVTISTSPVVLDNGDNGTVEKAQTVTLPADIAGRIGKKNDRHWYSFEAKKGDVWTLEVFADRIGSPIDAFFVLTDEKGKVIVEQDDSLDTLSPNQFFTRSDDPGRYRFVVPNDGTYKVLVSSREAGIQFGVRDQYVLRIAKEYPDFRLAVMPMTPHIPDAGTLPRNGATMFTVFVFRMDGFTDAITLEAKNLPPGVTCPPQVIGAGQNRGTLVLLADKDAKEWEGFVTITGSSGKLVCTARPFTVTWAAPNLQANQPPPNTPMITRMDRGNGLALAIRNDAPFSLTPTETEFKAKPGDKIEVTLKVTRDEKFKDAIQVLSGLPQQPGGKAPAALTTIPADKSEVKVTVDVPANLPPGSHTIVLRGQSAAPPPKMPNNVVRPLAQYPAVPINIVIEGTTPKKK